MATWIIFYLETALWVHYLSYVKGEFRTPKNDSLVNSRIFIPAEQSLINLKYEIKEYWCDVIKRSQNEKSEMQSIAQELL